MLPCQCPARSYQSAPPRFFLLALDAPQPKAPLPPKNILIEAAADNGLDETLEYAINAADFPEVASNAVVLIAMRSSIRARPPQPLHRTQSEEFA